MAKNGHVYEVRKVGRSDATPVDSYDLKSLSFKFGNDIFITFEMPGSSYSRPIDKIHISLQFRPSVIRGPWQNAIMFKERQIIRFGFIMELKVSLKISHGFNQGSDHI